MIELDHIAKTYAMGDSAVHALRGISLKIDAGEFLAIMGASGSGKSTLLHILGLLDVPDSGAYHLLGRNVTHLPENELAGLRNSTIGFIFQHFNLLPRTSAFENVILPTLYTCRNPDRQSAKARQLLAELGLSERMEHRPNELSGGQQQRVAIARALINDPRIIMADEPTGNLDSSNAEEIIAILQTLNQRGITIVMVTHEPDIARHAHRIIRMKDGLIIADQPKQRLAGKDAAPLTKSAAPPQPAATADNRPRLMLREIPHNFKQAWRALTANKVRTALSMLGILIGVTAVIAVLAIAAGASHMVREEIASMGSNLLMLRSGARRIGGIAYEAGAVTRFTLQDAEAIRATIPNIKRASGTVSGRGQTVYGSRNWNTRVLGVESEYAQMRAYEPIAGRFFTKNELRQRARVAVIGLTLVRELFNNANPLGETIKINKISFQVIGVLPTKGSNPFFDEDDLLIIPVSTAMHRLLGKTYLDSVEMEIISTEAMPTAQNQIKKLVINRHRIPPAKQESAFDIHNMAEIQQMLTETTRTMSYLLTSIAAISLFVGGIGIMNIMLVSVTERTREIGIRKAAGARQTDIMSQFLTEAMVISAIGGGAGIMLGWLISALVSALAGWPMTVTPAALILAVCFSCLIGIIFGLWPAKRAAKLNPIDALRYE